ncbi:MAG: thioesterase family protein [Rikenellaceae bacterium]|jgi:predicted thioesterase|nr:thioesterase family protein [Rikenellaceae bacterium]
MIEKGMRFTCGCTVGPEDTAAAVGSGDMAVLATPTMIAMMERAAMLAVADALPDGCTTVGTRVEVAHTRATPTGSPVTATAELTEVDGRRLVFRVEASDPGGVTGEGTHERFVVDRKKFLGKL